MTATEIPQAMPASSAVPHGVRPFHLALAWIFMSIVGIVIDLAPLTASLVDKQYLPIGPDSFYHARRVLDAIAPNGTFWQFDAHVHAPDGAIVSWPWGYDYAVSLIVRAAMALGISDDPMKIMVHIPVFALPITLIFVILACRALNLGLVATSFAMAGTVLFPLNQPLYSIGNIDHHYVEHMLVTASLAFGLRWLVAPHSTRRAVTAGIVIGIAPVVHTGEFILQIPLLATIGLLWLRGRTLPVTLPHFAIALFAATLVIALPSLALRRGLFDFLTLSWFQVYIAFCTALLCVAMSRFARSRNAILGLIGLCVLLVVPIAAQAYQAGQFLTSTAEGLENISETRSIFGLMEKGYSFAFISGYYTYLIVLVPLILGLCVWRSFKDSAPERVLLWVASALGLLLLLAQLRLHYFGSFALFLPGLVLLDERVPRLAWKPALTWALAGVIFLAMCSPGPRLRFFKQQAEAGDADYILNRALFLSFGKICDRAPGVVLAHPLDGNYLRFHTNCDVLGTNFLLTPQDIVQNRDARALFWEPAAAIPAKRPDVKYLFIRRDTQFVVNPNGMLVLSPNHPMLVDPPLVTELLKADKDHLPPGYRLVDEAAYPLDPPLPYARVFQIER